MLSNFPRRRLSAEELRDAVLATSGKLDREPSTDEGSAIVWEKGDRLATIQHLLGFDHTQLTFRHAGRDHRLTDVDGDVVTDILA